jgi:hypothetical protein
MTDMLASSNSTVLLCLKTLGTAKVWPAESNIRRRHDAHGSDARPLAPSCARRSDPGRQLPITGQTAARLDGEEIIVSKGGNRRLSLLDMEDTPPNVILHLRCPKRCGRPSSK